jgi:nanoRNase/pAp phosphatase (c-di-AMP/oligoRNAs hydrolase)
LNDFSAFATALPKEGKVVLCTHRHPDPDGLGALVGLQQLLKDRFGLDSALVLEGRIRRAENVAMRKLLDIHSLPKGGVDPSEFGGVLIVDSQPNFTHTNPPGGLPILAVIDHHEGPEDENDNATEIPFIWVDSEYGATSTMVYDLLEAFEVEPDKRTAAALFCGIRYDTNDLARDCTPLDERAFFRLQQLADRATLANIDNPPLPRDYFRQMAEAMDSCEVIGPVLLTLMEEVNAPEAVAEVADWFVRLEGQQWSLAGGACDDRYQVSLRTDLPGADAYPALRFILGGEGACGGHGRMAGGQVPLTESTAKEVAGRIRERAIELFGVGDIQGEPLAKPPSD